MQIGSLLSRHAKYRPHRLCLVFEDRRLTYKEFNAEVNRLANALLKAGLKKGERFATVLPNCLELMTAYWAAVAESHQDYWPKAAWPRALQMSALRGKADIIYCPCAVRETRKLVLQTLVESVARLCKADKAAITGALNTPGLHDAAVGYVGSLSEKKRHETSFASSISGSSSGRCRSAGRITVCKGEKSSNCLADFGAHTTGRRKAEKGESLPSAAGSLDRGLSGWRYG